MATASKSIPFVARPQAVPAPEVISQTELAMLLSLRGRLSQLETQVEDAEQSIRERLERGEAGVPRNEAMELKRATAIWTLR